MGKFKNRPTFSLDVFHILFEQAHWELVHPWDVSLAGSEDSLPEACYRINGCQQTVEVCYHQPLDQIAMAIQNDNGEPSFKLFFFLRKNGDKLINTLLKRVNGQRLALQSINNVLLETADFCQFTLLELPGEGLFEVGPQRAKA